MGAAARPNGPRQGVSFHAEAGLAGDRAQEEDRGEGEAGAPPGPRDIK